MSQSPKDKSLKFDVNPKFAEQVVDKNPKHDAQNNPTGKRRGNQR
ncbi:hypothetical protein ABEW34_00575 [Paenibacillus algorifonticola]|nr:MULTISPECIES: hypothetical protein [unclassified Paenibacillus]